MVIVNGVTIYMMREGDTLSMVSEMVALLIAVASITLAGLAEIQAYRQDKLIKRLISELNALEKEANVEEKIEMSFLRKLDEIIKYDEKIYRRLSEKPEKKRKK